MEEEISRRDTPVSGINTQERRLLGREARLELEKQAEAEGKQSEVDEPEGASSSASAKPAATPKEAGRCKEGYFCSDLMNHSCVYDTSSTVTMESVNAAASAERRRKGRAPRTHALTLPLTT